MKILLTLLLRIMAYASTIVSSIWAIVEFILYLVKDHPFNWWSVWTILICMGVGIILYFVQFLLMVKAKSKEDKNENSVVKSEFRKQMEEMRERKKRMNN